MDTSENAEKVLVDTRKAYIFGTRQGQSMLPTMDKSQAAKVYEYENMLRAAVNVGACKIALRGQSNNINSQGMLQVSGTQFMGRSAASPSCPKFDNTTSPLPYSNSPRVMGMVNAHSPQQNTQQQQLQQQQR